MQIIKFGGKSTLFQYRTPQFQTKQSHFFTFYCSIGFIVGTGQGRLTNGFISLYKPIHAVSFFLLPYVTLRNSPQLTGNLV
jgi:hypothetical protein